ncbi:MAG: hypothetical protein U0324_35560 [Polyangiales bacterium]
MKRASAPLALAALLGGCSFGHFERLTTTDLAARAPWAAWARLGCLDVGAHLARHPEVPREFVVVQYELGNRCESVARVDLAAVRVRAHYPSGFTAWLPVFDPRAELRPGALDPRIHAFQPIAYGPGGGTQAPDEVCVAPGHVAPDNVTDDHADDRLWCFPVPAYDGLPIARGGFG